VVAIAIFAKLICFMAFLRYDLPLRKNAAPWLPGKHCAKSRVSENAGLLGRAVVTAFFDIQRQR
jgi:hypothetical protein